MGKSCFIFSSKSVLAHAYLPADVNLRLTELFEKNLKRDKHSKT